MLRCTRRLLDRKGLREGIKVTTHYKDLGGASYSTEWNLNPFIYKDRRYVQHRGMDELVSTVAELKDAVEEISMKMGDCPVIRQENYRTTKDER